MAYAATFGLAARIGHRIAGPVAGVSTIVLLAGSSAFRDAALSGMESPLAAALGLAAILATTYRRELFAGVLVGLAVMNKLDAGFLAIAIAIGVTTAYRSLPWRLVAAAVVTFAPWAIFSQLYFGSVLPHSASEKLLNEAKSKPAFDHSWILAAMVRDHEVPILVLAIAALAGVCVLILRRQQAFAAALLALVLWAALHIIAYSYLNFGGYFPWYTTVVYPPTIIAAACALGLIVRSGWRASSALLLAIGITVGQWGPAWWKTPDVLSHGHKVGSYEAFERTRKEAGIFLGQIARPGDVVETCFGWIAYGALQTTIREKCPLSTRKPVADPRWTDYMWMKGYYYPRPQGWHLVRSFVSTGPKPHGMMDSPFTQILERDGS